jgi:hypothetical protein
VDELPKAFKTWLSNNQDRFKNGAKTPLFLQQNEGVIQNQGAKVNNITKVTEFVEAKTIKEANKWAIDNLNVEFADYSGLDVAVANDMNKAVYKIKQLMPDIKTNGLGSAQAANRAMKAEALEFYINSDNYKDYVKVYGDRLADKYAKQWVNRTVPNVGPNVIAWSTDTGSIRLKYNGELRVLNREKYKGVFVNEKYGYKVDIINDIVIRSEKSGFFTKGAKDFGYVTSHELGHEIDKTIGFRNSEGFKAIFAREHKKGIKNVSDNLSIYGATAGGKASHKPLEMIAEAWAEFTTSPTPRPLATEIGNLMLKSYYENYVQRTGTTYLVWKNDIMKILKP